MAIYKESSKLAAYPRLHLYTTIATFFAEALKRRGPAIAPYGINLPARVSPGEATGGGGAAADNAPRPQTPPAARLPGGDDAGGHSPSPSPSSSSSSSSSSLEEGQIAASSPPPAAGQPFDLEADPIPELPSDFDKAIAYWTFDPDAWTQFRAWIVQKNAAIAEAQKIPANGRASPRKPTR